jgi:hypothetical protein
MAQARHESIVMRATRVSVLTTWPFVLVLTVLIVNDAWMKAAWPGLVTGKLSDVAGIAVVALLALGARSHRPAFTYALIAAGFAWWKSPWSQPFIDAVNSRVPEAMGRTVDYGDLFALLVIPACRVVAQRPETFALGNTRVRGLLRVPILAATVLGLMATSVPRVQHEYQVRTVAAADQIDRSWIVREIEYVAREQGLKCTECADPLNAARYDAYGIHLEYAFTDGHTIAFKVWAPSDGMFSSKNSKKLEQLRRDLKVRLSGSPIRLEFVQPLDGRQVPP